MEIKVGIKVGIKADNTILMIFLVISFDNLGKNKDHHNKMDLIKVLIKASKTKNKKLKKLSLMSHMFLKLTYHH